MFNQDYPINTDFYPVLAPLASSDSPNSTPWNQQECQAFYQVPDVNNDPINDANNDSETNLAGWRTSILCPSIKAFLPINIEPSNANPTPQKFLEEIDDIADTTWECQDSIIELTFLTSCLSLSEHSTLQSKFNWNFYSNMENSGI